jgi:hypothetical protein
MHHNVAILKPLCCILKAKESEMNRLNHSFLTSRFQLFVLTIFALLFAGVAKPAMAATCTTTMSATYGGPGDDNYSWSVAATWSSTNTPFVVAYTIELHAQYYGSGGFAPDDILSIATGSSGSSGGPGTTGWSSSGSSAYAGQSATLSFQSSHPGAAWCRWFYRIKATVTRVTDNTVVASSTSDSTIVHVINF